MEILVLAFHPRMKTGVQGDHVHLNSISSGRSAREMQTRWNSGAWLDAALGNVVRCPLPASQRSATLVEVRVSGQPCAEAPATRDKGAPTSQSMRVTTFAVRRSASRLARPRRNSFRPLTLIEFRPQLPATILHQSLSTPVV
jgi:hypothetical protein